MSGMRSAVRTRSRKLSSVRVAYTPGTLQPNPSTIGMKDFPWSPIACIALSITKAARAM